MSIRFDAIGMIVSDMAATLSCTQTENQLPLEFAKRSPKEPPRRVPVDLLTPLP